MADDEPMSLIELHGWLSDKAAAKVKQVRVSSVLAKLPVSDAQDVELEQREMTRQARRKEAEAVLRTAIGERPITYQTANGPVHVAGPIVGTAEAAAILGVERPRIGRWSGVGGLMPPPLGKTRAGPIWLRSEVEALREATNRRRKPRKPAGATKPRKAASQAT